MRMAADRSKTVETTCTANAWTILDSRRVKAQMVTAKAGGEKRVCVAVLYKLNRQFLQSNTTVQSGAVNVVLITEIMWFDNGESGRSSDYGADYTLTKQS